MANEDPTQTARQPMDGTDKTTESSCEVYHMSIGTETATTAELTTLKGEVNSFEVRFSFCFLVDFEVFCAWFSCRSDSGSWSLSANENPTSSHQI